MATQSVGALDAELRDGQRLVKRLAAMVLYKPKPCALQNVAVIRLEPRN